jgi:hypothetical protein
MPVEVYLALGYAAFLMAGAGALDLMARHSHARSERYRTARSTTTPGSTPGPAPKANTCTGSALTTSGGSRITGQRPTSATPVR